MQILKESVRSRIRDAALIEFAAVGAGRATMNAIAERAEIGVATLYNYFESKQALLLDVIPSELADEFEAILERRVQALSLFPTGDANDSAEEILEFWMKHRREVVVLLDRAEGTVYEAFGQRFVERLTRLTLASLRAKNPNLKISAEQRLVLTLIFENTRRTLATLLERGRSERSIRESFQAFWAYQIPGLHGLADALISNSTRPSGTRPRRSQS